MTRENIEIKELEFLISDAERRVVEANLELQAAIGNLRRARGHIPRFKEFLN